MSEVDAAALASAEQIRTAEKSMPAPAPTPIPNNPAPQIWNDLSTYLWSLVDPTRMIASLTPQSPAAAAARPTVRVVDNEALLPTSSFKHGNGTLWQCDTNNKFLMLMCRDIIARRVATSNQYQRNWRWGVIFSLGELLLYQTITTYSVLPRNMLTVERHEHTVVEMPDRGVSCFHAYYPIRVEPSTPLLLLFPSLTANQTFYSFMLQYVLARYGWIVVVMNRRGLCERLTTPVFHIMGNDEDVVQMMLRLEQNPRLCKRRIVGMGLSMGGNVLTRYVGRYAPLSPTSSPHLAHRICAGVTICSPLNLSDIHVQTPLIEDVLVGNIKQVYLDPYAGLFANYSPYTERVYGQLKQCRSLIELAFLHIKLCCPVCVANQECDQHKIVVVADVAEADTKAKASAFQAMLTDPNGALPNEWDYTSPSMWRSYAMFDAARHTRTVEIPFMAITTGDDPIVRHSISTKRQLMCSRHVVRVHAGGGSHCILRDDVTQTNSCLSWGEQLALCFLHDNLELYSQQSKEQKQKLAR